jgi:hypothetical protein
LAAASSDALLRLLLEDVEDVDPLRKPHRLDRSIRVAAMVSDNLQDARAYPLDGLRVRVFLPNLREV